jgi:hypothetical protein
MFADKRKLRDVARQDFLDGGANAADEDGYLTPKRSMIFLSKEPK